MYRRCTVKFNNRKMEFVNCVNMVERIRKARALPSGMAHLGVKRYILSSRGTGKPSFLTVKGL